MEAVMKKYEMIKAELARFEEGNSMYFRVACSNDYHYFYGSHVEFMGYGDNTVAWCSTRREVALALIKAWAWCNN